MTEVRVVTPVTEVQTGRADIAHRNDPNAHPGQVDSHTQLADNNADDHLQYALADGSRGAFSQPGHEHADYADAAHVHADTAELEHEHTDAMRVVVHGNAPSVLRPTADVVYWRGSVEPVNAVDGDLWHDNVLHTFNVRLNGSFQAV